MNAARKMDFETRLAETRATFDASFAAPPPINAEERVRLLVLRAGKDRFAVRLSEVAGLHQDRRVVPLTGDAPGLIGMAGIRARVVPVFSLARLLGGADGTDAPRWLTVCAGTEPVALAFSGFEGHRELPTSALSAAGTSDNRAHVREVVRCEDGVIPVVSMASIVAAIAAASTAPNS